MSSIFRITDIGDEEARALAASENLEGSNELNLSDNRIGDEGARALAASENLRALQKLIFRITSYALKGRGLLPLRKT